MVIETDRLALRLVTMDDVSLVHDLFADPEVARWSGDGRSVETRDQAVAKTQRYVGRGGDIGFAGVFVVTERDGGEELGLALLVPLPASRGLVRSDLEIGWHFKRSAWRNGYATEAGRALADRAFTQGADEVYAVTAPLNTRSQAVCERIGMAALGLHGTWYDTVTRAYLLRRDGR